MYQLWPMKYEKLASLQGKDLHVYSLLLSSLCATKTSTVPDRGCNIKPEPSHEGQGVQMRSKICGLKLLKLKKKKKKVALYGKRFLEILPCLTSYTKINSK